MGVAEEIRKKEDGEMKSEVWELQGKKTIICVVHCGGGCYYQGLEKDRNDGNNVTRW
jgi:hypothetical protein